MRYLLMIYSSEAEWAGQPPETQAQRSAAYGVYTQELVKRSVMQGGDALQPIATATTVRLRNGERLVTDGPFAETKEQLGGFYVLDCKDLDEAIDLAGRCPGAQWGSIELRPIMEMPADYPRP